MRYLFPLLWLGLSISAAADDRQQYVDVLAEHGVPAEPAKVIEFLQPPDAELVSRLIQQLGTEDFQKREEATQRLLRMRVLRRDALLRAAKDKDPERAYRANYVLEHARSEDDEALLAALKLVRGDAYVQAPPVLIELLGLLQQPHFVADAASALHDVARPRHVALLRRSLQSPNANVRAAATVSLGAVLKEGAHDELRPLLSDADRRVRLAVALAMVNSGDPKALTSLGEMLEADDIHVRACAVRALWSLSRKRCGYLACDKSTSRQQAARAWRAWIAEIAPRTRLQRPLHSTAWVSGAVDLRAVVLQATLRGHHNEVPCVVFSPDGKTIATGSWDNSVMLWDAATGESRRTLSGHTGWVRSLAFSPDGEMLLSGSVDETIRLWDPSSEEGRQVISATSDKVFSLAYSPDGSTFASAASGGAIKIWSAADRRPARILQGHRGTIRGVAFSHDGTKIASASGDGTLRLWDAETGRELSTLQGHSDKVWSVDFSPDDATLASSSGDGSIKLWDTGRGTERITLAAHAGTAWSVAFSPCGGLLASSGDDRTIKLWDVQLGELRETLTGHSGKVSYVAFSPNGRKLASASADRTAKLWQIDLQFAEP